MTETNNEKKMIRVLDGVSHGGTEIGLVYYCASYRSEPDDPAVVHLQGVVCIEAKGHEMDFRTDLVTPADLSVKTDEQLQIETTTLPRTA